MLAHELAHALDIPGIYFDATDVHAGLSFAAEPARILHESERDALCVAVEFDTGGTA